MKSTNPYLKEQRKRELAKERREQLIPEVGGGLADLSLGAVRRHAPWIALSDDEMKAKAIEHVVIGRSYRRPFQLAEDPSPECLEALAVWHPFALRHLLSLDPRPQMSLLEVRRRVADESKQLEKLHAILDVLQSTRTAFELLAKDEAVRSLAGTHSALSDVVARKTTKQVPTEMTLSEADVKSDKVDVLRDVEHVLFYLRSDVRSVRDSVSDRAKRAKADLASITGAKKWSSKPSLAFSRRLVTLVDALRTAYPVARWPLPRVAKLIRASSTDWTIPPCPELASKEASELLPMLKMRIARERSRRGKLKLTARDVYPWLVQGNNSGLRR